MTLSPNPGHKQFTPSPETTGDSWSWRCSLSGFPPHFFFPLIPHKKLPCCPALTSVGLNSLAKLLAITFSPPSDVIKIKHQAAGGYALIRNYLQKSSLQFLQCFDQMILISVNFLPGHCLPVQIRSKTVLTSSTVPLCWALSPWLGSSAADFWKGQSVNRRRICDWWWWFSALF